METVPVQPIELSLSPSEAAQRLCRLPGFIFLDTADSNGRSQAVSIIAAKPVEIHRGSLIDGDDTQRLRRVLNQHRITPMDWGFPVGGLFGHVSYEGDFLFGEYDSLLVYHHHFDRWFAVGQPTFLERLNAPSTRHPGNDNPRFPIDFESVMNRQEFMEGVTRAQEWISDGDIYQVNLTQRFQASRHPCHDSWEIYDRLRSISPAPYGAYLDLGGQQVLSSSPECFLRMSGRGVSTRPIKGTRPRFNDPQLDEKSAYDLITSPKEISELVMITDLERNDIGRLCEYGSVNVSELLSLERFAQVFHLVSTVTGELRPDVDHLEALRLCSPGGSITGAPKQRAMQIIEILEPVRRGLYTGSIGYLGWNGESQFNIAIRTLVGETDHWHFHVGAGIVAESDPSAEYEETLHKAAGILLACESQKSPSPIHTSSIHETSQYHHHCMRHHRSLGSLQPCTDGDAEPETSTDILFRSRRTSPPGSAD